MRITRSIRCFLLSVAVSMPTLGQAAATVSQLESIRDNNFKAATQLMMYVTLEKAKERRQLADKAIASVDSTVASIGDPELATQWQATSAALKTDVFEKGEINQLTIYAWENATMAMAAEVDRRMPRDIDRSRKDLYELASRMQLMTMIYLRNSADPLGGSNYTGVNSDKELSKLATDFTRQLGEVTRKNPKLQAPLSRVQSKWAFLSQRISDYKTNVPFIVDLYGRQINDMLVTLASEK